LDPLHQRRRLRALYVPDSVHWVTGTLARNFARFNPWVEATIASGAVIEALFSRHPELIENFDLVHFTCPYASREGLARFAARLPCVTSHHHTSDWELLRHNVEGDAIIVGSPEWAQDLRRRGVDGSRIFCVPYGVDAEKFVPVSGARRAELRAELGIDTDAVVVGFFGKNSSNELDRKGIDVFSAALRLLSRRQLRAVALIVGPGWQEFVSGLSKDGVKSVWLPFVLGADALVPMYQVLDFYWVTSRVEGGPVTLLEAMSSGVCCLTTPVGIAREIVRHGENAMLLPFDDPQAFGDASATLALDAGERTRLGHNARDTIVREMRVALMAPRVREVYAKALENFSLQAGHPSPIDVSGIAAEWAGAPCPAEAPEVPLAGIPPDLHAEVRTREALIWAENLILYHGAPMMGLRMILGAWRRNPASLLPARVLFRRFMPPSLVGLAVTFERKVRRWAKPGAGRSA
jgi:glycosyltransferase involved in cell wall biosynthesis